MDTVGLSIFTGLLASGLIGGSVLALSQDHFELWHVPVIPAAALVLAAALAATVWTRYLITPRLRKISVAAWLRRRRRWKAGPR